MSAADAQAPVDLRVIWEAPSGIYRFVARDWPDCAEASYDIMARRPDGVWVWASDVQRAAARDALYQWLDAQNSGQSERMRVVL